MCIVTLLFYLLRDLIGFWFNHPCVFVFVNCKKYSSLASGEINMLTLQGNLMHIELSIYILFMYYGLLMKFCFWVILWNLEDAKLVDDNSTRIFVSNYTVDFRSWRRRGRRGLRLHMRGRSSWTSLG